MGKVIILSIRLFGIMKKDWIHLPYKKIKDARGHKLERVLINGVSVRKCRICGGEIYGTYNCKKKK